MKKRLVLLFLALSIGMYLVSAHVEHAEAGAEEGSFWYQIFVLHDWIHPVFFLLLIYSCYYFRFFSGRKIAHQPKTCLVECQQCYSQEGWLKQHHRFFFWGTFLLSFVHAGELLPSLKEVTNFSGVDLWVLGSETVYLAFAFLYLITCYHFRYCVERGAKKHWISYKVYNGLTALNRYHNVFFWLTLIAVAIRFTLVAIATGSILEAIPGTF